MTDLEATIEGCRQAHGRLAELVQGLSDDATRAPSLLPGWTVGHVLTHIARNADSMTRRIDGAARDKIVDQYRGGAAGRSGEIDQGAFRAATALVADVLD